MPDYLVDVDIDQLMSVYNTVKNKIKYYETNIPYAKYEISDMEAALHVIWDLITEINGY